MYVTADQFNVAYSIAEQAIEERSKTLEFPIFPENYGQDGITGPRHLMELVRLVLHELLEDDSILKMWIVRQGPIEKLVTQYIKSS